MSVYLWGARKGAMFSGVVGSCTSASSISSLGIYCFHRFPSHMAIPITTKLICRKIAMNLKGLSGWKNFLDSWKESIITMNTSIEQFDAYNHFHPVWRYHQVLSPMAPLGRLIRQHPWGCLIKASDSTQIGLSFAVPKIDKNVLNNSTLPKSHSSFGAEVPGIVQWGAVSHPKSKRITFVEFGRHWGVSSGWDETPRVMPSDSATLGISIWTLPCDKAHCPVGCMSAAIAQLGFDSVLDQNNKTVIGILVFFLSGWFLDPKTMGGSVEKSLWWNFLSFWPQEGV